MQNVPDSGIPFHDYWPFPFALTRFFSRLRERFPVGARWTSSPSSSLPVGESSRAVGRSDEKPSKTDCEENRPIPEFNGKKNSITAHGVEST